MCAKKYLQNTLTILKDRQNPHLKLRFLEFQLGHRIKKDIQDDESPFKESIMGIS